jgi:putative selenium metabolism hydrolase
MAKMDLGKLAERVQAEADHLYPAMVHFLADLIRIRSYTGQEQSAVERTLAELRAIGCDRVWMDSAGDALGQIGDQGPILLYDAHLDTNEIADEGEWLHPPLEAVMEGDVLYGLGASDCKAGVAAIVYGAAILKQLSMDPGCRVVVMGATLEEDAEGFALRSLVESDGLHPAAVLLAEATDLSLRRGHRGRCELRLRTSGKAVHASTPYLGENAILKMLPVIEALERMQPSLPVDPIFGQGSQVITLINGPHTPNSVPAWCEIALDRRLVPGETPGSVLQGIRDAIQPLDARVEIPLQPVHTHTGLDLDDQAFFPGWLLDADSPVLSAGQATCQVLWNAPAQVSVWKFSTDGTYSAGVAGIPTLGFGPQEERFVHTPFDQINLEKLKKATMFYALFPFIYSMQMHNL